MDNVSSYERIWAPSVDGGVYDPEIHVTLNSGQGVWATTTDGRRLMDANAGLWHLSMGYAPPQIVEVAAEAMRRLGGTSLLRRRHSDTDALVTELDRLLSPMDAVFFFGTSGSEAVDAALRIALAHGVREDRATFGYLTGAYHGASWAPLALNNSTRYRSGVAGLKTMELPSPARWSVDPSGCALEVESAFDRHGSTLAAVIVEPVQCVGGIIDVPADYLRLISRLAAECGALVIVDEVSTGVFRSGSFLASPVLADMVILAKGLTGGLSPMSVVAVDRQLADRVRSSSSPQRVPGSTQSGDPVGCVCAAATLRELASPASVDSRDSTATAISSYLHLLANEDAVETITGDGHLWGIRIRSDVVKSGPEFIRQVTTLGLAADLLLHPLSVGVIPVMPALTISPTEVADLASRLTSVLAQLPSA